MAALDYLDFDLEVEAGATPELFKVSVLASPRGEASGQMMFPFSSDALENVILKLGRTRSGVRAIGSPTQDLAQKFGTTLYDALFAGEVGTCFRRSLDEADAQGKGLRIRLRLEDAPQLADVPWEYLYPSGLRQFLVLSTRTPIVRYLELPQPVPPLQVTPPLRVLVVVSSPSNLATLNVEAEVQRIRGALASLERAGQVRVVVIPAAAADGTPSRASLMDLRRALRSGGFHVLHFIGHGGFVDATGEGMLAFEDENHLAHMVSGTTLATTISGFDSLRLVLLNACEGARQSPADPLGGVAQSLVKLGNVPAVVAMQFEITDEAATVFSSEFYAAIADGYPIDAALAEARVAVFSDNNDVEWGTPVLYLRASDGRIFDVAGGAPHVPPPAAATGQQGAAGEQAGRVVPVVVPPWPGGAGTGSGAPVAGASGGGSSTAEVSGAGSPDQPPLEPKKPGRGLGWAILAAVAAVVALAMVMWPRVFPGGSVAIESPTPTGTLSVSPTPTLPTTPSPSVSRTSLPPVRDVGTLKAVRVTQPLTIDGNTDDWQWQLVARADQRIAGSSSATGDIYLMWDDQALYLLASVTDATPLPPDAAQPSRVFRGDSVILELGPDKSRLSAADLARPTDAYYMFGLPVSGTPVIAILGPNAKGTSFETPRDSRTLDAAITLTGTGYVLEARIPWATTRLNGVRAGAAFAANVQVSQRKADGYANLGMMSTNPQRTADVRAHPAYWQALQLQA